MRKAIVLTVLVSLGAAAQVTRRETEAPETSGAKPNSPDVPSVIAVRSQFERVVILRFKYDTELLEGLQEAVKQNKIKIGVILAAAGSVRNYQLHQVSNRTLPAKLSFEKDPTGAADLIGMNGYIFDGHIHPHMTLANADKAFGGHLEPGTTVFTFAIVTIGVLPDNLDMSKFDATNYR
jgi:predicted DNA-binding protein with PD1-like motif